MSRVDSKGKQQAQAIKDAGGVMTHRQILFVIFGLMAGMFLSSLDQTIVSTSMRTIADDLDGLSQQVWVTTAYLILATISTPIYGKLSDIFGRRPLFIIAISIFLIGSIAAGFATSMYELAAFRAVQGLGAGGLMALPLAIMGDILAPRERAKYQGYFLAVFGVSSVIGPLIGGLFAGASEILFIDGWRWVFLINLPIGAAALAIVIKFLHIPHERRDVRIDWWGASTIIIGLVPLLLVAEQGREWGWGSLGSIACYVIGVLGLAAFVLSEKLMGDDALIPLKLFTSSTFAMATVLGVLVGFGMFGAMMTLPLYLQVVNGATPTESGFLMLPMILGLMISSIVSGQFIARTGRYQRFPTIGLGFMATGFFVFTFATADKPVWFIMIGMLLTGLGLGQLMQTLTLASQNAVGPRDMGVATSASTFFRQIGGTVGTAVIFSVIFTRWPLNIATAFDTASVKDGLAVAMADPEVLADPDNAQILGILKDPSAAAGSVSGDTSFLNTSDPRLSAAFLEGFANSAITVFWIALAVVLVAFVVSFFLKAPPLRAKSALQENADASAAEAELAAEAAAPIASATASPSTSARTASSSAVAAEEQSGK